MALTDTETVRLLGGLNAVDGINMFRLESEEELLALIEEHITTATAWLRSRASSDYDDTGDTDKQELFRKAEAYLTLYFLCDNLKARKVFGTHWAVDSEDSSRYEELIETEWLKKAEFLVDNYLTIDLTEGAAFAAPVMVIGEVIRSTEVLTMPEYLQDLLEESLGVSPLSSEVAA